MSNITNQTALKCLNCGDILLTGMKCSCNSCALIVDTTIKVYTDNILKAQLCTVYMANDSVIHHELLPPFSLGEFHNIKQFKKEKDD